MYYRNDEIDLEVCGKYDKIVISPGPGVPDQAGITKKMIRHFAPVKEYSGSLSGMPGYCRGFWGKPYQPRQGLPWSGNQYKCTG